MTGRIGRALAAVGALTGAPVHESVCRADVRGEVIALELSRAGERRWFRWTEGGAREVVAAHDEKIPAAADLLDGDARILAYRPGRRLVVARGEREEPVVVKALRPRRAAAAARRHRRAAASGAFRVAALVDDGQYRDALAFSWLSGRPAALDRADDFYRVGQALRRFQDAPDGPDCEQFDAEAELAVLDTWRARVEWAAALPAGWTRVRDSVERACEELPAPVYGLAHRDLHDRQLSFTDGGPALFDFDLSCVADVALDPANLAAHLTLRALQRVAGADLETARACRAALLAGLARAHEPGFEERFSFYETTTLLRLALVYQVRPRWSHLTETLVGFARLEVAS